jgi:response regulator RpfG family c-di-GMP phosphodiesterase
MLTLHIHCRRAVENTKPIMKKVLIAKDLQHLFMEKDTFLNREDITIFTTETNDEALKIHIEERADLIVTKLDQPGLRSEELFEIINQSRELREVLTTIICDNTLFHRERSKRCGAHAVFTMPIDVPLLHLKMRQFLDVAPRQSYRVALNVAVEGKFNSRPFLYRTENISATGMLIKAEDVFAQGDRLSLSFYLPEGARVSVRGEVVRIVNQGNAPEGCLYGIKFLDLAPSVRFPIDTFIKKELKYKRTFAPDS